ncbi:unnamed protein product [Coregonus sp. 'balchen']|nr:unnamed protein product [Coregonus sp. 'balchen']
MPLSGSLNGGLLLGVGSSVGSDFSHTLPLPQKALVRPSHSVAPSDYLERPEVLPRGQSTSANATALPVKKEVPLHLCSTTNQQHKQVGVQQQIPTKLAVLSSKSSKSAKASHRTDSTASEPDTRDRCPEASEPDTRDRCPEAVTAVLKRLSQTHVTAVLKRLSQTHVTAVLKRLSQTHVTAVLKRLSQTHVTAVLKRLSQTHVTAVLKRLSQTLSATVQREPCLPCVVVLWSKQWDLCTLASSVDMKQMLPMKLSAREDGALKAKRSISPNQQLPNTLVHSQSLHSTENLPASLQKPPSQAFNPLHTQTQPQAPNPLHTQLQPPNPLHTQSPNPTPAQAPVHGLSLPPPFGSTEDLHKEDVIFF